MLLAVLLAITACNIGPQREYMEALIEGKLVYDEGCLRIEHSNGSYLLVLHDGFSVGADEEGTLIVDDDGQTVARIGDYVSIGGGESSAGLAGDVTVKGTPGGCDGPYWLVGESIRVDPTGREKAAASNLELADLYFPVQKEPQTSFLLALLPPGKLVADNGYLRVKGYLIIWPYGYSLKAEKNEIWVVNDKGQPVARVGDEVRFGGGELPAYFVPQKIAQELPIGIEGPFWELGGIHND